MCKGDSLTAGTGATAGQDYPAQLAPLQPSFTVSNVGQPSEHVSVIEADAWHDIDQFFAPGSWVILWEGTNDTNQGATAIVTYNYIKSYGNNRRNTGFKFGVCTLTPRTDSGFAVDFETKRQAVNTSIRSTWQQFADALIDIGADSRLGPAGSELDATYYNADRVHMVDAGYAIVAGLVSDAITNAVPIVRPPSWTQRAT